MDRQGLGRVRSLLAAAFGPRLQGVVLYGSEARGDGEPDSDVDLLVLLTGPIRVWEDIRTITAALYPLQLEMDRPLSAIPAEASAYDAMDRSLYRNARREGIRV